MGELVSDLKNKSTFHEIKNQISVCDLYLEVIRKTLIKENIKNENIDRALNTILNSVKAIGSAMQELKAQVVLPDIKNVHFKLLVDEVYLASICYADGKEITFINDVSEDFKVYADKDKMYSVFINLCKNAVEAVDKKGYVKIYNDSCAIYVENNGIKIPEEIRDSIFNDGFTTKREGSGLGLMLVKNLLELQNSKIELLTSNEEKTVFKISLNIC